MIWLGFRIPFCSLFFICLITVSFCNFLSWQILGLNIIYSVLFYLLFWLLKHILFLYFVVILGIVIRFFKLSLSHWINIIPFHNLTIVLFHLPTFVFCAHVLLQFSICSINQNTVLLFLLYRVNCIVKTLRKIKYFYIYLYVTFGGLYSSMDSWASIWYHFPSS